MEHFKDMLKIAGGIVIGLALWGLGNMVYAKMQEEKPAGGNGAGEGA